MAAATLVLAMLVASPAPASADDVNPMTPLTAPTVSTTATTVSCVAGTYSQDASYVAYSLLVDGAAVATATTDDSLPLWLIPNLADTVTTDATLQQATFTRNASWTGKTLQCSVLAYADHATGFIYSDEVQAK